MDAKVGRQMGNTLKKRPLMILGQEMDGVKPKAGKGSLHREDSSLLVLIAKGTVA